MASEFEDKNIKEIKATFWERLSVNPMDWVSCIFYSSCLVIFILYNTCFELSSFDRRIISRATAENFDIASRVNLYYLMIFIFALSNILFKLLAEKIQKYITSSEHKLINFLSLCGVLFLLFGAFTADPLNMPVFLVLVAHGILSVKIGFRVLKRKTKSLNNSTEYNILLFSFLTSVSLFFFCKFATYFLGVTDFINLYIFLFIAGSSIYVSLWNYLTKFSDNASAETKFHNILRQLKPLFFFPVTAVITTEIYLFLNQKNIFHVSQNFIFLILIVLLIIWHIIERYRKTKNKNKNVDLRDLLFRFHVPVFLVGFSAFVFYVPILNETQDLYEIANSALSIQQFYEFQKIPFIDTFNTHELSEILFPFTYTSIYGFSDLSYLLFNFLHKTLAILLVYFLITKYTRNPYIVLYAILFFPFFEIILPYYYYSALLFPLILGYATQKQTIKSFILLFSTLLFLILWKMDIGFACFFAGIISIILFSFAHYKNHFNLKALIWGFIYFCFICIALFTLFYLILGNKLIRITVDVFSFFDSVQAYGFPDLIESSNIFFYLTQYFVFPALITFLVLFATIKLFRFADESGKFSGVLTIYIFIGLFYLINFHRGLVRHSLIENSDGTLMSLGFFLLGGSIFILKPDLTETKKFIIFISLSCMLVLGFKFPRNSVQKTSLFGLFLSKVDSFNVLKEEEYKISRAVEDTTYAKENYRDLVHFFDVNLSPEETFVDFTNSPMLYFYAHKENPCFFNQPIYNAHDEYLQKRFIEQVQEHDAPFVLFSKHPVTSGDCLDGIPNAVRHYLVAEFIYINYEPYVCINKFCVWKRKDFQIEKNIRKNIIYDINDSDSALSVKENLKINLDNEISLNKSIYISFYFSVKKESEIAMKCIMNDTSETYIFNAFHDSTEKTIQLSANQGKKLQALLFIIPPGSDFTLTEVSIIESDILPDVFSSRTIRFPGLKYIPYVWGTLDNKSSGPTVKALFTLATKKIILKAGVNEKFLFQPINDKINGNYLVFNALNPSGKISELTVEYGSGRKKNGSFTFYIKDDFLFNTYKLRLSTQYNWMALENDWISFSSDDPLEIESVFITAGD